MLSIKKRKQSSKKKYEASNWGDGININFGECE
jgi:hypothetical protein